jgi:hypothetical protein
MVKPFTCRGFTLKIQGQLPTFTSGLNTRRKKPGVFLFVKKSVFNEKYRKCDQTNNQGKSQIKQDKHKLQRGD